MADLQNIAVRVTREHSNWLRRQSAAKGKPQAVIIRELLDAEIVRAREAKRQQRRDPVTLQPAAG